MIRHGSARVLACVMFILVGCIPDGRDNSGFSSSGPVAEPSGVRGAGGAASFPPAVTPPNLVGAPVVAAVTPPPISGGTLLVLRDGVTAVASDPDRDSVFVADLAGERLLNHVALQPGDEPGRLVEDGAGMVLVALRRGGAVVAINPKDGSIAKRVEVCPVPRGIAVDSEAALVYVACAGGELVVLSSTLDEVKRARLDRDLRDVVVSQGRVFVSRFRAAELLAVDPGSLAVISRTQAPGSADANRPLSERARNFNASGDPTSTSKVPEGLRSADPEVAWRLRPLASGGAIMLHQEASNAELGSEAGGYGSGICRGPMGGAVVEFAYDGNSPRTPRTSGQIMATLPVDFDVSADRKLIGFVTTAGAGGAQHDSVALASADAIYQETGGCVLPQPPPDEPIEFRQPAGDAVAVAFDGRGRLVVQTREPARLEIVTHKGGAIKLSDESREDSGHRVFHMATEIGLACASCHPEGGDDGRVWRFTNFGQRRTQNLAGGIAMTAPFHWDGNLPDLGHLMDEVFTTRMRGPQLDRDHVQALGGWLDKMPALKRSAPADTDAVTRGQALFNDPLVACATCHKGELFTDNTTRLVGTGAMMQVPSLRGVAFRAPYMHNGCAKTLLDRFSPSCGGGDQHGRTSNLSQAQLEDLVAYMESL